MPFNVERGHTSYGGMSTEERGHTSYGGMSPIGDMDLPLVNALEEYRRRRPVRLHVPGHGGKLMDGLGGFDVTELEGLDDLHHPVGVIAAAQEKAAKLYGARHTFFLVNGTTVGIQALIAACCDENQPLVLPRNAHRSVLGGLIISGARPIFLAPEVVPGFEFAAGVLPQELADVLRQNPGVGAVLAVHPNYYGVTGDLGAAAAICHRYNVPLLVDEAHGTHLRFHPDLPADALSLGADAVVQSVHKTGGALTQSSWLHLSKAERGHTSAGGMSTEERGHTSLGGMSPTNGRVDRERVAEVLRLLQTTSPSYLLMASLDAARGYLAQNGRENLDKLLCWIHEAVPIINKMPGLTSLGTGHLGSSGITGHDLTRLVVSVRQLGISGHTAARWLAQRCSIYVEMSDVFNIVAVLSLGTTKSDIIALVNGLAELSRQAGQGENFRSPNPLPTGPPIPPQVLTPRQAWLAPRRAVPMERAAGQVSAESVAVYPPGITAIYPGEEITPAVVEYLLQVRECGLHHQGAADLKLNSIQVLDIKKHAL